MILYICNNIFKKTSTDQEQKKNVKHQKHYPIIYIAALVK